MKNINCEYYVPAWEGNKTSRSQPDFCLKHRVHLMGNCITDCEFNQEKKPKRKDKRAKSAARKMGLMK